MSAASTPGALRASPAEQEALLAVQALDTRLAQLTHRVRALPEHAALATLDVRARALRDRLVAARTALSDVTRAVTRAETDVEAVRSRAERTSGRLAAGTGTAKDLQALTRDAEALARRLSDLEDTELEVMEQQEAAAQTLARLEADEAALVAEHADLIARRDAAAAAVSAQAHEVRTQREQAVAGLSAPLVALYDTIRAGQAGLGAAALEGGRCGGCRMQLTSSYLATVRAAPADAVLRCEECGRILVRPGEATLHQ